MSSRFWRSPVVKIIILGAIVVLILIVITGLQGINANAAPVPTFTAIPPTTSPMQFTQSIVEGGYCLSLSSPMETTLEGWTAAWGKTSEEMIKANPGLEPGKPVAKDQKMNVCFTVPTPTPQGKKD
jgi:hypothetical protein